MYYFTMLSTVYFDFCGVFSRKRNQEIAQFVLAGSVIECKLWENSVTIVTAINSGEIIYPSTKKVVLQMRRVCALFCFSEDFQTFFFLLLLLRA